MITGDYDHIWDCCCDHGLLGKSLLKRGEVNAHIHFVDIVPELMTSLKEGLQQAHGQFSNNWTVHCCDIVEMPLSSHSGRHLVIIAGVGGDLTQDFMISLENQYTDRHIDYLLCPVYHQFDLRKCLIDLDFVLHQEHLVYENKRYYEVMLVSKRCFAHPLCKEISFVGEDIWRYHNEEEQSIARGYLQKKISHYKRRQCSGLSLDAFKKYQNIIVS